jgi:GT2 family glycosyltransferase
VGGSEAHPAVISHLTVSVLIPSWKRPAALLRCLRALARQTRPPDEVFVIWQADDVATAEAVEAARGELPATLRLLHSPTSGVVPAENLGLRAAAAGDLILLIDDDAVPPPDWVARHAAHYADPTVGAVGGPADNYFDGRLLPRRSVEPVGRLTWYGRALGNMFNQPLGWRGRPPRDVDHLVGYNLSFRRAALGEFEAGLRRYWQLFELDACLQVKARGYRVLFDFANVVDHFPTNTAYTPGRGGDLVVKVDNGSYNQGFVLAKHSTAPVALCRLLYLCLVGSTAAPGLLASLVAWRRFGNARLEFQVLRRALRHHWLGWRAGRRARRSAKAGGHHR